MSSWFNPDNSAGQERIKALKGKTILAADDEPDALDTVVELSDMCLTETAGFLSRLRGFSGPVAMTR